MALPKKPKRSPAEGELPFEYDFEHPAAEVLTTYAGLPLLVRAVARRCADQKIATLDLDTTVIESWKREAKPTYEGSTGYQPMLALWAEMDLVVADEFRDGNVGAHTELLEVTQRALAAGVMPCARFGANAAWLRLAVGKTTAHSLTRLPVAP